MPPGRAGFRRAWHFAGSDVVAGASSGWTRADGVPRRVHVCNGPLMSPRVDEVLPTREARAKLPSMLAGFRARGAEADPVVIGAHRRPEAVVLSYERYLTLLSGRERVDAILADRRISPDGMGEDQAMEIAVREQHASRR